MSRGLPKGLGTWVPLLPVMRLLFELLHALKEELVRRGKPPGNLSGYVHYEEGERADIFVIKVQKGLPR
jgi:hypothetical protein